MMLKSLCQVFCLTCLDQECIRLGITKNIESIWQHSDTHIYWLCTHYRKIFDFFFFYLFLTIFCAIKIKQNQGIFFIFRFQLKWHVCIEFAVNNTGPNMMTIF